jgi:hypothetical protein
VRIDDGVAVCAGRTLTQIRRNWRHIWRPLVVNFPSLGCVAASSPPSPGGFQSTDVCVGAGSLLFVSTDRHAAADVTPTV